MSLALVIEHKDLDYEYRLIQVHTKYNFRLIFIQL